jgi:hypothetical protein
MHVEPATYICICMYVGKLCHAGVYVHIPHLGMSKKMLGACMCVACMYYVHGNLSFLRPYHDMSIGQNLGYPGVHRFAAGELRKRECMSILSISVQSNMHCISNDWPS